MQSKTAAAAVARLLLIAGAVIVALALPTFRAHASGCPEHPDAIGTGRTMIVDPTVLHQVGTEQYAQTLPLRDYEVVLTFDDGPSPLTTEKVLDALAAECASANFFIVGEHARERPDLVGRAYRDGHTVGTHSQTHPDLARMPLEAAEREIDDGNASVQAALGPRVAPAPFFRAPYLQATPELEQFLVKRGLMQWSADIIPQDWQPLTPEAVVARTLNLLQAKGSGIILMHDVQPHTAAALPMLLRQLKEHGYSIVRALPTDVGTKPLAVSGAGAVDGTQ
jgi:peptidoglycan/xylan/chitin deacetylase (PgdA/CDA1 family)